MARAAPNAVVHATDKSDGMLTVGRRLAEQSQLPNLELAPWDVTDARAFPFPERPYELIVSSVMVPYLDDAATGQLVHALAARLAPGGTLVFVEQDLLTDSVNYPEFDLLCRVFAKDQRALKRTVALGLRPLLRASGLEVIPTQSFLWTDTTYGAYLQDLLGKLAADALEAGRISEDDRRRWLTTLDALQTSGDFQYGLVYHRIAGLKPA